MSKENSISGFDPDGPGITTNNIFGLPFSLEESKVVILPVPWDVTTSNKSGAALGPQTVKSQSFQIDLYDEFAPNAWKNGIFMENIPEDIVAENKLYRKKAEEYIDYLEQGNKVLSVQLQRELDEINFACKKLITNVSDNAYKHLLDNKLVALLGGDHSVSTALLDALSKKHKSFGVLHLDAHADLRDSFEGFQYSHASVMFNALKLENISKIVQVGVRDFCESEKKIMNQQSDRIKTFTSRNIHNKLFNGINWNIICFEIINNLPDLVYISFDVDFLKPSDCPNTGTPVPGGFDYEAAMFLMEKLVENNKRIIGFDLVETGNGEIDGVVSCRILYRMINIMLKSNNIK